MDLKHAKSSAEKLKAGLVRRFCKPRDPQHAERMRYIVVVRSRTKGAHQPARATEQLAKAINRNSKYKLSAYKTKLSGQGCEEELNRKIGARKLYTQYEYPGIVLANSHSKITCSVQKNKNTKPRRRKAPRNTVQDVRLSGEKETTTIGSRCNSSEAGRQQGKARKLLGTLINRIKSSEHTLTTALSEKKISDNSCEYPTSYLSKKLNRKHSQKPLSRPTSNKRVSKQKRSRENDPPNKQHYQLNCPYNLEPIVLNESNRFQPPTDSDSKHLSIVRTAMHQHGTVLNDIFANSPELTPKIRAVLVDWLFRITSEMMMQRQTVSLAMHYLDEYLQRTVVHKLQYQLMALAALLIAYKQYHSHHDKFVEVLLASCYHGYSKPQLLEAEMKMALGLEFKLNPPTYNFWIEYFTARWDRYLQKRQFLRVAYETSYELRKRFSERPLLFREASPHSYSMYRYLLQLVDTSLYCETTVRKFGRPRLVAASLYLMLRCNLYHTIGLERMLIDPSQDKHLAMHMEFQQPNSPIFRDRLHFNPLFNHYLTELCYFELADIVPEIKYLAGFMAMPFSTALPDGLCSCEYVMEMLYRYPTNSSYGSSCIAPPHCRNPSEGSDAHLNRRA